MAGTKVRTVFPTRRIPLRRRDLLALLADGKWKSMQILATLLSDRIPPECAIRHAMTPSGGKFKRRSNQDTPIDQVIAKGYRAIIAAMCSSYFVNGWIEKETRGRERYYRLTKKGIAGHERQVAKARNAAP